MVNTTPFVVFDLDDVLANLRDPMMTMLRQRTGKNIHWSQWQSYELGPRYGTSSDNIMEWVLEDEVLEAATLEPYARPVFEAARQNGYRIAVVTARAWHPRGEELTREWLEQHELNVDELHLVPMLGNKAAVLSDLGVVEHFIDDHLAHLYPASELPSVRQVLLVDRPWNRSDASLRRLQCLGELKTLLECAG
jgi:5'(3')-deoxyribonucleotidase